jgi:hypothetical protein
MPGKENKKKERKDESREENNETRTDKIFPLMTNVSNSKNLLFTEL